METNRLRITKAEAEAINLELDDLPALLRSEVQGMLLARLTREKIRKRLRRLQIVHIVLVVYCAAILVECLIRRSFGYAICNGLYALANVLLWFNIQRMLRRI